MSCTKCDLHKTCKNILIPGRGSVNPKVMFVGQAPGFQEEEQGKCFVGPAGQLLTQAIREFDLRPVWVTNVVKCFPPEDRDPKAAEIELCKPYLMEEIEKMKPEVIVALGNIPLKALTGKTGVTDYSGSLVGTIGESQVFSLLHPSFILRYPQHLPKFEMHLRALQRVIGGGSSVPLEDVRVVSSKEAYHELKNSHTFVSFDFETTEKSVHKGGKLRCVGFDCNGKTFIVPAEDSYFDQLMRWFIQSELPKCAFNAAFEIRWCLDVFGMEPKNLVYDPILMHYLVDENSGHDLESVASQILKADSWDIYPEMIQNGWTYADIPFKKLAYYCGLDCINTRKLVGPLAMKLKESHLIKVYKQILLPLAKLCARLEHRGMKLDKAWAAKVDQEYANFCKEKIVEIQKLLKLPEGFNPNSSLQISKIVKKLKLSTGIKTDGGRMSVKESAMRPLKEKHPFVGLYLDWKEKQILRNNFLQKFPKFMDASGFIHPSFNPAFVVTGRMAVSNPPAHAVPADQPTRGMIVSRFPGGKVLSGDFDQLEMRLVASESGEERLLRVFLENLDPHDITAEFMFGKGFTKDQRHIAKQINFGTIYGVSEYTLSRAFQVSPQEATHWLDRYRKAYPRLFQWMNEQHDFLRKNGYIRSRFGRVRHLPEAKIAEDWALGRLLRQAGNFPIQSLGADITNLVAIGVDQELSSFKRTPHNKSMIFHQVHDSILVDVFPGEADQIKKICFDVIKDRVQSFCRVQLSMSFEVGERWGCNDEGN